MKYKYGSNWGNTTVSAQIVGEELEKLVEDNEGALLPDTVVKSAQRKSSRLHPCFEWDDKIAAKRYRLKQANQLILSVVQVEESGDPKDHGLIHVRAFPNIETEDGSSYYTATKYVSADPQLAEQLESQVYRELMYLAEKYEKLQCFFEVWQAIRRASIKL